MNTIEGEEMSTVEDFENAPVGATATHKATGDRAMKMDDGKQRWMLCGGSYLSNAGMAEQGFTLDAPAPATAREALDLAWELGHEVKEGHVIPRGTRYLEVTGTGLKEYTAQTDFNISPEFAPIRTLEPLPEPEPEWLGAPAVIAVHDSYTKPSIWGKHWDQERLDGHYQSAVTAGSAHWSELRHVTPLYPLAEGTLNGTTAPDGYTPSNSMGFKNEGTDA